MKRAIIDSLLGTLVAPEDILPKKTQHPKGFKRRHKLERQRRRAVHKLAAKRRRTRQRRSRKAKKLV